MIRRVGHTKSRGRGAGFTLLEVLVALVIVSLGMIAVFSQLSQMLNATSRLRDKTLAHWIAVDQITELKALAAYPSVGQKSDEVDMAKATWVYNVKTSQIGDLAMRRVDVTVAFADFPEDILAEVSGFLAAPQQAIGTGQPQQQQPPPQRQQQQQQQGQVAQSPDQASPDEAQRANAPQNPGGPAGNGTGFGSGWEPLDPYGYDAGDSI